MMEPATKRQKTAGALTDTEEDDELFLEPEELNQRRDPSFLLAKGRAKAATQLKSRFEDIFAKYERDFTGIGDEIDLATGEVVVDNGHLSSMRSMKDWIVDDEDGDGGEDENDEGEGEVEAEESQRVPFGEFDESRSDSANGRSRDPWRVIEPSWPAELASREHPILESMLPPQSRPAIQSQSFPSFAQEPSASADPTWQAPELPASAFSSQTLGLNGRHYGGPTPVVTRTILKRSLKAPDSPEADNEDDLQVASGKAPTSKENRGIFNTRESPLIKKLPLVDSSPHDDGLRELIQDVIENIPDTPPSIRRSWFLKSQGKPSPLNHEHRIDSKPTSKLSISNAPVGGNSHGIRKKRGRPPKVRADPSIGEVTQSTLRDQHDQSPWEESDLESFLDITSRGINKPAGQTLYVDIKTSDHRRKDMSTAEHIPVSCGIDAQDEGFIIHEELLGGSLVQRPEPTNIRIVARDHQNQDAAMRPKLKQSRHLGQSKPQESFERNYVDPAFDFSDEETLLPKRLKKKMRPSERTSLASLPSPPILDPTASKQGIAGHPGASVEHEPITNAQGQDAARYRIQTNEYGEAEADNPIISDQLQAISISKEQQDVGPPTNESVAKHKIQRRRSQRITSMPDSAVKTTSNQGKAILSSAGNEQLPPVNAHQDKDLGLRDSPQVDQEMVQPVGEARTGISRSPVQRTAKLAAYQSELREHQNQSSAVSERSSANAQSAQPATPSRPRPKHDEKMPSFSTSVLSLLSDSDDDEDELSFNLSDFTPSGHHRILTHRPFPEVPMTPQFSASATSKKRVSLLHSRSRSSSSHRISKPPQTPRSAGAGRAGSASRKGTHRKSHQLARSVVRVARRLDSDHDREGSVLQTPGGSKRRCGEDGWKCERDFCFVCME